MLSNWKKIKYSTSFRRKVTKNFTKILNSQPSVAVNLKSTSLGHHHERKVCLLLEQGWGTQFFSGLELPSLTSLGRSPFFVVGGQSKVPLLSHAEGTIVNEGNLRPGSFVCTILKDILPLTHAQINAYKQILILMITHENFEVRLPLLYITGCLT